MARVESNKLNIKPFVLQNIYSDENFYLDEDKYELLRHDPDRSYWHGKGNPTQLRSYLSKLMFGHQNEEYHDLVRLMEMKINDELSLVRNMNMATSDAFQTIKLVRYNEFTTNTMANRAKEMPYGIDKVLKNIFFVIRTDLKAMMKKDKETFERFRKQIESDLFKNRVSEDMYKEEEKLSEICFPVESYLEIDDKDFYYLKQNSDMDNIKTLSMEENDRLKQRFDSGRLYQVKSFPGVNLVQWAKLRNVSRLPKGSEIRTPCIGYNLIEMASIFGQLLKLVKKLDRTHGGLNPNTICIHSLCDVEKEKVAKVNNKKYFNDDKEVRDKYLPKIKVSELISDHAYGATEEGAVEDNEDISHLTMTGFSTNTKDYGSTYNLSMTMTGTSFLGEAHMTQLGGGIVRFGRSSGISDDFRSLYQAPETLIMGLKHLAKTKLKKYNPKIDEADWDRLSMDITKETDYFNIGFMMFNWVENRFTDRLDKKARVQNKTLQCGEFFRIFYDANKEGVVPHPTERDKFFNDDRQNSWFGPFQANEWDRIEWTSFLIFSFTTADRTPEEDKILRRVFKEILNKVEEKDEADANWRRKSQDFKILFEMKEEMMDSWTIRLDNRVKAFEKHDIFNKVGIEWNKLVDQLDKWSNEFLPNPRFKDQEENLLREQMEAGTNRNLRFDPIMRNLAYNFILRIFHEHLRFDQEDDTLVGEAIKQGRGIIDKKNKIFTGQAMAFILFIRLCVGFSPKHREKINNLIPHYDEVFDFDQELGSDEIFVKIKRILNGSDEEDTKALNESEKKEPKNTELDIGYISDGDISDAMNDDGDFKMINSDGSEEDSAIKVVTPHVTGSKPEKPQTSSNSKDPENIEPKTKTTEQQANKRRGFTRFDSKLRESGYLFETDTPSNSDLTQNQNLEKLPEKQSGSKMDPIAEENNLTPINEVEAITSIPRAKTVSTNRNRSSSKNKASDVQTQTSEKKGSKKISKSNSTSKITQFKDKVSKSNEGRKTLNCKGYL